MFRKRENCPTPIADDLAKKFAEGRFTMWDMYKEVASFWVRLSGRMRMLSNKDLSFEDLYFWTVNSVSNIATSKLCMFFSFIWSA